MITTHSPREPLGADEATVASRGHGPVWNLPGTEGVRLFHATWINPRPDLEITRLTFRLGETAMKPLVVAVTAEWINIRHRGVAADRCSTPSPASRRASHSRAHSP